MNSMREILFKKKTILNKTKEKKQKPIGNFLFLHIQSSAYILKDKRNKKQK